MAIPTATKLEITLRYLATGDSFKSLDYLFRFHAYFMPIGFDI
jgi:hypothetical protein